MGIDEGGLLTLGQREASDGRAAFDQKGLVG